MIYYNDVTSTIIAIALYVTVYAKTVPIGTTIEIHIMA